MNIRVSGGASGPLKILDDLKVHIAFNKFDGDEIVSTIFPSINKNASGNYEAIIDAAGMTGGKNIVESVVVESKKITYVILGIVFLFALIIVFAFARK